MRKTQSPSALAACVRYLILPEFHLQVLQPAAHGMKWNTVIHFRIQIVRLIVPHRRVAGQAQGSEQRIDKAAIKMAGKGDFPWSRLARQ